jgi:hypothetical protein
MKLGQVGKQLSDSERGQLIGLTKQPGFEVLKHIFEEELEEMNIELLNVASGDEKTIISKHNMAKAATMFYARTMNRITQEESYFGSKVEERKVQPDTTEALFQ